VSAPDPVVPVTQIGHARGRRDEVVGVAMYAAAAFLFAVNTVMAKPAIQDGLDPGSLIQLRNAGAAIVLLLVLLATRPAALRITRSQIPFLVLYGVLAFAVTQFLFFFTISRLPVGIGTLLAFLAPVVVTLWLRIVAKRATGPRVWLALALTLAGLALVAEVWRGLVLDPLGLVAGLGTAVALASYWLLGEEGNRRRDALSLTFWGVTVATIAWSAVQPWWTFPWAVLAEPTTPLGAAGPTTTIGAFMVWNVLMGTLAPFLLVLGALRRIGSQRAGIIGTTEPVWAVVLAFALLGEALAPVQLTGAAIVLAAILLAESSQR
jgi:drug/metabolite transporter (DMT)-like permease